MQPPPPMVRILVLSRFVRKEEWKLCRQQMPSLEFYLFVYMFGVFEIKPRATCMLNRHSVGFSPSSALFFNRNTCSVLWSWWWELVLDLACNSPSFRNAFLFGDVWCVSSGLFRFLVVSLLTLSENLLFWLLEFGSVHFNDFLLILSGMNSSKPRL